MRTHLGEMTCRLLISLLLVGCQETSTDPQGGGTASQSGPRMSPAISNAGRTTVEHFVANGEFGVVGWAGIGPHGAFSDAFLTVERGDTLLNPEVFLSYQVIDCFFEGCEGSLAGGAGRIPRGDFKGTAGHKLKLSTNTCANPDFAVFLGPCGLISVEWTPGVFETRFSGTTEQKVRGVLSSRQQGTTISTDATVTGNVVGFPIQDVLTANMGKNHNVVVTHFFNR